MSPGPSDPPRPPQPPKPAGEDGFAWKPWVIGALALIALLFIAQNAQKVTVDFIFANTDTPLIFALALSMGLGFAIGLLLPRLRGGKKDD